MGERKEAELIPQKYTISIKVTIVTQHCPSGKTGIESHILPTVFYQTINTLK